MATPLAVQVIVTAKDAATAVLNKFGSSVTHAAQSIKNQLTPALTGLATVGGMVTGAVALSIKAFSTQEDAMARLRQGLKNVNESLDDQGRRLLDQASALQKVTRFSDEEIISAQGMLTTFLLNTNQIEKLTPRILDMAEALRNTSGGTMNLEQASILLGKAIGSEDVAGLAGALRRVGVVMTEHQTKVLETGNMTDKLTVLTQIMDQNFRGFAEAGGATFSGRLDIMKNQLSEVQEAFGGMFANALSPLMNYIAGTAIPKLNEISTALTNNKDAANTLSGVLASLAIVGFGATIIKLVGVLGLLNPVVLIISALAITVGILATNWKGFNDNLRTFADIMESRKGFNIFASIFGPLGYLFSGISALVGGRGGRQAGGFVSAGSPVTVGEGGPEVFVPPVSGMIEPRGGGGSPVTLNVNVGLYAGTETEKRRIAEMLYGELMRLAAARKMTVEEAFAI